MPADLKSVFNAAGFVRPPPDLHLLGDWYAAGADLDRDILPTIRRMVSNAKEQPFRLKYFDGAIRDKTAEGQRDGSRRSSAQRRNLPKPGSDEAYLAHAIDEINQRIAWEARKAAEN